MYVIKLKKADNTISLRNVRQSITLQQVGRRGPQGDPGTPGVGVPAGGSTGESLVKVSDADYDTGWAVRQSFMSVTVGQSEDADYTTDGVADEVQINQAFADLTSTGGEIILLDQTYNISAPIVATNYVNLRARNKAWFSSTSMIVAAADFTGDDMLQIFIRYPGIFDNVAFDGDGIAPNGVTVGISNATIKGLKLYNLFIQGCTGYGLRGNPNAINKPQPYCWDDAHFWNLQLRLNGTGLELNTSQTSLHGCLIAGNNVGVEVLNFSTLQVIGGTFSSNGTDILVTGDNFFGPLLFNGTWFEGATEHIIIRTGTPTFTDTGGIIFQGCHLFNQCDPNVALDFTNIHGSVIFDNPALTSAAGTNKTIQLDSDLDSGRSTVVHIRGRISGINFDFLPDDNDLAKIYYDDEVRGSVSNLLSIKNLDNSNLWRFDGDSKNMRFANGTSLRMYSNNFGTQVAFINGATGDASFNSMALSTPLSIANGGTGSSTQNFVDLTTAQTVGGAKTFSATASFGQSSGDTLRINPGSGVASILRLLQSGVERGALFSSSGSTTLNLRSQASLVLTSNNSGTSQNITINNGNVDFGGQTLSNIGNGASGSFTAQSGETVTVTNGIITSIV